MGRRFRHRKRKPSVPKTGSVFHMSSVDNTLAHMPRYDAWAVGGGVHGHTSYHRASETRSFRSDLESGYYGSFDT